MNIIFSDKGTAFEDFTAWAAEDKAVYKRILSLIKEIRRDPFKGLGRPEPLKHALTGYWSREIDEKHRLVYRISKNKEDVIIASCKYHYKK
jgi:toxin YoeB